MIRFLRRWLSPTGDVYVVIDTRVAPDDRAIVVGVSAKMQGAEQIRHRHAKHWADLFTSSLDQNIDAYDYFYNRTTIVNKELEDYDQ